VHYYLYKLRFTSTLHIGNDSGQDNLASAEYTIHSDTLFSALCIEALNNGGEKLLQQVYTVFQNGQAVLSDAFPFRRDELFLPKPIWQQKAHAQTDPRERKLYKKLSLLPLSLFKNYISASETVPFDVHKATALLQDLFFYEQRQCVAITGQEETQPYFIGGVVFNDDCGLYLIAGCANNEIKQRLDGLLQSLASSGIGGKRNVGFGRFNLDNALALAETANPSLQMLEALLKEQNSAAYMTLNTSLPEKDELSGIIPGARFLLCRRGGYVQSNVPLNAPLKKKSLFAFAPGSCFTKTYHGAIYDLSCGGQHPVYRYLKPLFMGVPS